LTNGDQGWKHMEVGEIYAGKTFVDYLGNCEQEVVIGDDGWGDFLVESASISAWVPKIEEAN
ncbi:TPA: alpha-amylase domain-containing protein, partial [Streptococcus agalactiae]